MPKYPNCLTIWLDEPEAWRTPLDARDLAVRLETDGVTDSVAQAEYSYGSTYQMATEWFPKMKELPETPAKPREETNPFREHLKGTGFTLPLALCCLVMLGFGFSLWGGDLEAEVAAAVAVGTISSFIVTGGIVQAMAWQGMFYLGSADARMGAISVLRWCVYGVATLAATVVAGLVLNWQFAILPSQLAYLAAAFFVVLGLLWFATGILYMLDQHLLVTGAIGVGITMVVTLRLGLGWELTNAQLSGIFAAAAFAALAGYRRLKRRYDEDSGRIQNRMLTRTLFFASPYLSYGILYYLLLFVDRIVALTAHTGTASMPLVFRGDYELPLDIALLGFILSAGWVHASTHLFRAELLRQLPLCSTESPQVFNYRMSQFYFLRVITFLPGALAANLVIWFITRQSGVLSAPGSLWICGVALLAYPFLTLGLWNVSVLFSLSLPGVVLSAAGAAVLLDTVSGYVLSRSLTYDYAVVGFLVGAVTFGLGTAVSTARRLKRLDYYYFASGA